MPHVMIDPRRIRPVSLDGNKIETFPHDEIAGDPRAYLVEFRGAVRRFAN